MEAAVRKGALIAFMFSVPLALGPLAPAATAGPEGAAEIPSLKKIVDGTVTDAEYQANTDASDVSEGGVPDQILVTAILLHQRAGDRYSIQEAINWMRMMILQLPAETIRKNRALVASDGLAEDFQADFDNAIEWVRTMRADPRRAYEASKDFRARGGSPTNELLAEDLVTLAGSLGLPEARFDEAQRYFSVISPHVPLIARIRRAIARGKLHGLALENYLPAQIEIAARYIDGRRFDQNNAKAYYWLRRARANGANVEDQLHALDKALTAEERRRVTYWFEDDFHPGE